MSQPSQSSSQLAEEFYERNLPDVTQMLKYAKIGKNSSEFTWIVPIISSSLIITGCIADKNNLTNVTQAIYFPKQTSNDLENFMLLELNPALLEDVEKGENLYLKGKSYFTKGFLPFLFNILNNFRWIERKSSPLFSYQDIRYENSRNFQQPTTHT